MVCRRLTMDLIPRAHDLRLTAIDGFQTSRPVFQLKHFAEGRHLITTVFFYERSKRREPGY